MFISAFCFIGQFGSNNPYIDDFSMIPYLVGRPVSAEWLWSQHNEHRIPLPRLVLLALYRLTDYDFRAGMFFNASALGVIAFALILAVKRMRGWIVYTDAVFPIALLHWGHWENLLWSFQVGFVLPTLIALTLLLMMAQRDTFTGYGSVIFAGVLLVLLPLCGAPGLAYVPALSLWVIYAGVVTWCKQVSPARRKGGLLIVFGLIALLITGAYFIDYKRPSHHPLSFDIEASLTISAQFLSASIGPAARIVWPYALVILGLLLGSIVALIIRCWELPEERVRCLGFMLFLIGMVCLATGIGWGRAGFGKLGGFVPRYITLATPALLCVYFIWQAIGGKATHFMHMLLFTLFCTVLSFNVQNGLEGGKHLNERLTAFQNDLISGIPLSELTARYTPRSRQVYPDPVVFITHLRMLRDAHIGHFSRLQDTPEGGGSLVDRFSHGSTGVHDSVESSITGWAWDPLRPDAPIQVDIYSDNKLLATIDANRLRPDLLRAGFGNGKHGFICPLPSTLKDGHLHSIRVRISGTNIDLKQTPRNLTFVPQ